MGNTSSTTSKKHQKRASSRKPKYAKKSYSPATTNRAMRSIKAMVVPMATKKAPRKRTKKPVKKSNASSKAKKYGPVAWSKAKASGVGPFNKRAPPSKKAGLFNKFAVNKLKH